MKLAYVLHHSYESSDTGEEETKLIGVYSSRKNAGEAIRRLRNQPGFKDLPEYFSIDEYVFDQDNWAEGFVAEKYEPVWSVWRQDDNGNVFLVKDHLTEIDALRLLRELEGKGHRQTYWAKENL